RQAMFFTYRAILNEMGHSHKVRTGLDLHKRPLRKAETTGFAVKRLDWMTKDSCPSTANPVRGRS
ncbi:hypothetical protein, partial [Streptomyces sp. NPDC047042]|uniref:hypothetical protein n=1 Tax=Streptomyces sp. NPDC047042 TaxID=3154807 RepID=UPI0033CC3CAF